MPQKVLQYFLQTENDMSLHIRDIMYTAPVIPVITIDHAEDALPLADCLVKAGLKVLEITLRTPAALEAISLISKAFPEAITGAGTIINPATLDQALAAGADFIVSPGATPALLDAALASGVPILPGVNTPSEIMVLLDRGITAMKFFPAEAAGGVPMLSSIAGPLPQALFCPTGGIKPGNARDYLALGNVACVGGTWLTTRPLMDAKNWTEIGRLASEAARLRQD
jgi:2-dehydro-3-deoxyphosphogluconate aldolase/(4S)-4-hydroxy-2-oxoglutarate aldolase